MQTHAAARFSSQPECVRKMVRSSRVIVLITTLFVVVLTIEKAASNEEWEASVGLLPNDLMSEDLGGDTTDKAIITPKQVIENQVSKTWQSIVKQMVDSTSTGMKQKRTVPAQGGIFLFLQLLAMYRSLLSPTNMLNAVPTSKLMPGNDNPLNALGPSHPNLVPTGGLVPDLNNPASATSYLHPGGTGVPVVNSLPDASHATGMVAPYSGGNALTGGGMVPTGAIGAVPMAGGAGPMAAVPGAMSAAAGPMSHLPVPMPGGASPMAAVPGAMSAVPVPLPAGNPMTGLI
uniref:Uncharacterized protein n=1 Tax=Anopheles funestus TaxID=62324 RepID=A0A182RFJ0_ANOFN